MSYFWDDHRILDWTFVSTLFAEAKPDAPGFTKNARKADKHAEPVLCLANGWRYVSLD